MTHAAIVSDVSVGDIAFELTDWRLNARVAAEHALVGCATHSAVKTIVLERINASLPGHFALPGVGHTRAAEDVVAGYRVKQQYRGCVAVIL